MEMKKNVDILKMKPKFILYDLFKVFILFCLNHVFYIDTKVKIPVQAI